MHKRAIESVEVWMWMIAGLVIGALVFVGGYTMLSHWIRNNEVATAQKSFASFKASVLNVCNVGTDRQEINSFVFPRIVNNITVYNKSNSRIGAGHGMCMDIQDEGIYCEELNREPNNCRTPLYMDNLNFERDDNSLFAVIQKALGEGKASKIRFTITKKGRTNITIDWAEEFLQ